MKITYTCGLIAALSMLSLSQTSVAETTICLNGSAERKISIVYDVPGQAVPCEVTYEKGAGIESLWRASNKAGYCEAKAAEFIEKQRGWGWDCATM